MEKQSLITISELQFDAEFMIRILKCLKQHDREAFEVIKESLEPALNKFISETEK